MELGRFLKILGDISGPVNKLISSGLAGDSLKPEKEFLLNKWVSVSTEDIGQPCFLIHGGSYV